ncbi:MAG: hypothetical protein M1319_05925 [Chloroflexi bacterium]|nr:hypothetical protein [Chloroflexota bacterium]
MSDRDSEEQATSPVTNGRRRRRPERVAWFVLALSFLLFLSLCGATGAAAYFYRSTATETRNAKLELIDGDSVFVRERGYSDWRQATNGMTLSEGDAVRTGTSSRALVTLFDTSTILLSGDTEIVIVDMKTSRYISRTKQVRYTQTSGRTRVGMAALEDYSRYDFEVTTSQANVLFDVPGGSYLVEVGNTNDVPFTRVEARRGTASVSGAGTTVSVDEEQKTIVNQGGVPSSPNSAQRELLANGDFGKQMEHWSETYDQGGDGGDVFGKVTLTNQAIAGKPTNVVEFRRVGGNTDYAETGIHQNLNAEVVDFINLRLKLDARIAYQSLSGGGSQSSEYPLMVRIRYLDANGNPAEWYHGFYYQNDDGNPVRDGEKVEEDMWQTLQIDLRDMYPRPVTIKSLDIFAAGHDYDTLVANISLAGD